MRLLLESAGSCTHVLLQRSGVQRQHLVLICFFKLHPRMTAGLPERRDAAPSQLLALPAVHLFACHMHRVLCLTPTLLIVTVAVGVASSVLSQVPAQVRRTSLRPGAAVGGGRALGDLTGGQSQTDSPRNWHFLPLSLLLPSFPAVRRACPSLPSSDPLLLPRSSRPQDS